MAQPSFIQGGIDRFESTFKSIEKDWKRLQTRADKRRKELEKRAERQVKRLQTEFKKNPLVKRAEKRRKEIEERVGSVRSDAQRAIEGQVETLLGSLRIASSGEIGRLERKVNALNRKLRALEKELEVA